MKIAVFAGALLVGFFSMASLRLVASIKQHSPQSEPVLVSLSSENEALPQSYRMNLQWGGFYCYRAGAKFRVFRLIDLNTTSYHIITFNEEFERVPSFAEVSFLFPKDRHETGPSTDTLAMKPILLGKKEFEPSDLTEFTEYLGANGYQDERIRSYVDRVTLFSVESALDTLISRDGDRIEFEQAVY